MEEDMSLPEPTGKDYHLKKIPIRKSDPLLKYMQAHNIDYTKKYEVIEDE
jgi:hypothetical protein